MTEKEMKANITQAHIDGYNRGYAKAKDQIADIKANCDLAIEGRDVKIKELEQQIEKMKCCQNCKYEDKDCIEEPCCDCSRILGDIKRKGTSDKWELENDKRYM